MLRCAPFELIGKVGARVIGVAVWGLDDAKNRLGYGYGYGHYTGGYYYNRSEYSSATSAKDAESVDQTGPNWVQESAGRRVARMVGRGLTGVLVFLAVIAVIAAAAYLADQYFGLGLTEYVNDFIG